MAKMQFSADIYRIACRFISMEETRYYLRGILIEPNPGKISGVRLVATDGHRMFIAHDHNGATDSSGIVQLSNSALKECKTPKKESLRVIRIDGNTAQVMRSDTAVAITENCLIDGTYPDYRRVVPKIPDDKRQEPGIYNGNYLGDFGWAANEFSRLISGSIGKDTPIRIVANDPESPALVFFPNTGKAVPAFGVIMPLRPSAYGEALMPDFWSPLGGENSDYLQAVAS